MAHKIMFTKNYRLFDRSTENRPLDVKRHKKLMDSMKRYGFLKCFPIVIVRDKDNRLIVRDGQHRLVIAETLGLPVYWVEEDVDFDVAVINCTAKTWVLRDYAQKHSANGLVSYQQGLEFADQHGLPVGTAFALLAGTTSFGNCQDPFVDGTFKIKDRAWADTVAGIYQPIVSMAPVLKSARFIEACMVVCRAKSFDPRRLLTGAERCREKLVPYSTKDAYLDMLEIIYNFGRKQLVGLKTEALMAMRERNAVEASKAKKKNVEDAA
jgi:ParB-like nuclease family protein